MLSHVQPLFTFCKCCKAGDIHKSNGGQLHVGSLNHALCRLFYRLKQPQSHPITVTSEFPTEQEFRWTTKYYALLANEDLMLILLLFIGIAIFQILYRATRVSHPITNLTVTSVFPLLQELGSVVAFLSSLTSELSSYFMHFCKSWHQQGCVIVFLPYNSHLLFHFYLGCR